MDREELRLKALELAVSCDHETHEDVVKMAEFFVIWLLDRSQKQPYGTDNKVLGSTS